jgi:hypothetical protein
MLETHISAPIPRFTTLHKFGGANKFADQNNFYNISRVPLEGLEPPTVSLGRNCSSIELQRLAK